MKAKKIIREALQDVKTQARMLVAEIEDLHVEEGDKVWGQLHQRSGDGHNREGRCGGELWNHVEVKETTSTGQVNHSLVI